MKFSVEQLPHIHIKSIKKILGFDEKGNILNSKRSLMNSWENTINSSNKIFTFLDTGGYKKHDKSILQMFLIFEPNFIFIVLDLNSSIDKITEMILEIKDLCSRFCVIFTHSESNSMIEKRTKEVFLLVK